VSLVAELKCVLCKHTWRMSILPIYMPTCPQCGGPTVLVNAKTTKERKRK
jgi:Zn finger protein HypA/HybF involved in hydrogenase expression